MAIDWTLYKTLLDGSARDYANTQAVDAFIRDIVDDPAYQEAAIINGRVTPIAITRTSSLKCSIKAAPETDIHIGDMVECFGDNWIIVELYTDKIGLVNGTIWLCNDKINFQNNSAITHTKFCVVDDGSYSKRIRDPEVFVTENTYKVYLTFDEATKKLFIDKRLAFGICYSPLGEEILEVYKIIGMDTKSRSLGRGAHLMVLTVQRDVYNPASDSIDENICDIYKDNEDSAIPQMTGNCVINGRDTIRIGTSGKFAATFTNAKGKVIDDISPIWTITAPTEVTYAVFANTATLDIPLDENLVGETISILIGDENELYGTYEKKVQVITVG